MSRRVVITGVGLVTPLGIGARPTWEALCAGKSGVGPITRFDASDYPVTIAAEVKDFRVEEFLDKKFAKHLDLFAQYAVVAAGMALKDARIEVTADNAARIGTVTGTGLGGLPTIEKYHQVVMEKGPRRITPFFIPMVIPNMGAGQISIAYGIKGPNLALSTACAAGSHAVGEAFRLISAGSCDMVVTGGSESVVCPLAVGGFASMKALSTRNDDPAKASRPFDSGRDGFIISEGAGILILESLESALKREAPIYAEMAGYGLTSDGYHMAAPPEDGEGAVRCMAMALDDADMAPADIDYINAHGTSTPLNDVVETRAVKTVFGANAKKLAISSTKSMTGHMLGGAGGIEAVFTALTIHEGVIPPTINLESPDPECDLDYVPNEARRAEVKVAMSNSFGFGGTNAVLVMKRFEQ
ncbi:MAG: beta-ketoacyl-ACP synthase II [Deltaproteobacteria bacterium]|jgi:3-oxoacyl-[acyl-carrier-protein] synthase II